jgi:threonine/homoserine/homoserine lactone efflux protein
MDFAAGLVGGFLSSTPLGPINLIVIDLVARRLTYTLLIFLLGVLVADAGIATASLWGLRSLAPEPHIALALAGVCAVVLMIYAVSSWRSSAHAVERPAGPPWRMGAVGFSLCLLNPLFALFWVTYVAGYAELFAREKVFALAFAMGIVFGDVLWFGLLAKLAGRVMQGRSTVFLTRLRRATALGVFGCALYLLMEVGRRAL